MRNDSSCKITEELECSLIFETSEGILMCILLNSYSMLQWGFHIMVEFICEDFKLDESEA